MRAAADPNPTPTEPDEPEGPAAGAGATARPARTDRERELLAVALELLHEAGYDGLTVDEVAARAHASKATVYRRWPSKAALALAAFNEGVRRVAVPPHTGNLRDDLIQMGRNVADQVGQHGPAVVGILPEVNRSPALREAMQEEFVDQRRATVRAVLQEAVERGEIAPSSISDDLWDVLPGYLVFRSIMPGRPPTEETIVALVDEVILPSLTRGTGEVGVKRT